jgi:hypothetical protein
MSLTAKDKGPSVEPVPAGVHVAVCYGVVDLGTQFNPKFNKHARKVLVLWELPQCRADFERDGQKQNLPRAISQRYTLSLSEKANLRRDLESWRGRKFSAQELNGFDLQAILGAPCQLQIVHEQGKEGRPFAAIAAIMALPKGATRPKPENPLLFFTFEGVQGHPALPPTMPDWIKDLIAQSREWTGQPAPVTSTQPSAPATDGDDLPF